MMSTPHRQPENVGPLQDAEWLYRLLDDVRRDVAHQPSGRTIERIRNRLLAQIKHPAKAAA